MKQLINQFDKNWFQNTPQSIVKRKMNRLRFPGASCIHELMNVLIGKFQ